MEEKIHPDRCSCVFYPNSQYNTTPVTIIKDVAERLDRNLHNSEKWVVNFDHPLLWQDRLILDGSFFLQNIVFLVPM